MNLEEVYRDQEDRTLRALSFLQLTFETGRIEGHEGIELLDVHAIAVEALNKGWLASYQVLSVPRPPTGQLELVLQGRVTQEGQKAIQLWRERKP